MLDARAGGKTVILIFWLLSFGLIATVANGGSVVAGALRVEVVFLEWSSWPEYG